ncbi:MULTISPECIES: YppG family protein [unclassified Virgibacillus]|uniref:YppG family protein n=1 Tax=unclassified Virgibacillus TaxID=2620237 RepID=UPI0024DEEF2F|nr:YppG family protein [Virgibacillus sp. LDC-1]
MRNMRNMPYGTPNQFVYSNNFPSQEPYYPYYPSYQSGSYSPSFSSPFLQYAKPPQPVNWYQSQTQAGDGTATIQQPQSNGIFSYFQDEKGQVDLDKMLTTVGKLANTYQQVSPMVQQFGSFIKGFR